MKLLPSAFTVIEEKTDFDYIRNVTVRFEHENSIFHFHLDVLAENIEKFQRKGQTPAEIHMFFLTLKTVLKRTVLKQKTGFAEDCLLRSALNRFFKVQIERVCIYFEENHGKLPLLSAADLAMLNRSDNLRLAKALDIFNLLPQKKIFGFGLDTDVRLLAKMGTYLSLNIRLEIKFGENREPVISFSGSRFKPDLRSKWADVENLSLSYLKHYLAVLRHNQDSDNADHLYERIFTERLPLIHDRAA